MSSEDSSTTTTAADAVIDPVDVLDPGRDTAGRGGAGSAGDVQRDGADDGHGAAPPDDGNGTGDAGDGVAPQSFAKSAREWVIVVVIAITAAVVMKVFVVQQFYVSGHSMDTTLHDLDRVLVNKLSYDLHDPNRGDVVVLEEGIGQLERDLIKRVIALPGETIEIKNCVVYINGRELVEPYLDPAITTPSNCGGPNYPAQVIPDHMVFVMGDNRPNSGDSRGSLGPVDYDKIVGRAFVVIWPKDHWQWL